MSHVSPTQVKVSMKFNGHSGVQLRAPRDLSDLAAYTALKFYLQSPKPESGQAPGDRFVLYLGSRQVPGGHVGWAGMAGLGACHAESPVTAGCRGLHGRGSAEPEGTLGVPPGGGRPRDPQRR